MKKSLFATVLAAHLLWASSPALAGDHAVAAPPGGVVHAVVAGEEPSGIAELYGVSERELTDWNSDSDWETGTLVIIPPPARAWPTHTVRAGETLWRIGKAYGVSVDELRQANSLRGDQLFAGRVLSLPRAVKPAWTLEEPAPATVVTVNREASLRDTSSETTFAGAAPRPSASTPPPAKLQGNWVEVRLPDNRRAWAPVGSLVVGSWQPQSPDTVLRVAREFIGVPYRWGGVDPNGWDCSGFVQEVYRLGGHQVPRMADAQYEACAKVQKEMMLPGDLVFFNTDGSGVSHVGIYTGDGRFLHASSSRGVVEDTFQEGYFSTRLVGAGRIPAWEVPPVVEGKLSKATE